VRKTSAVPRSGRGFVANLESALRLPISLYARLPLPARWLAPAVWAALIWYLSSCPGTGGVITRWQAFFSNGGHAALYAILTALLVLTRQPPAAAAIAWRRTSALIAILYGVLDETHQLFVPLRSFSIVDMVTDACGAWFASCWLGWWSDGSRRSLGLAGAAFAAAVAASVVETVL
jgi:hypothetical protein